jgi:protein-S-isoprenylcysteine O-methyltransferase Ste14
MEHPQFADVISAAFLLFLGGTRCYYLVAARTRPGNTSNPRVDRALQVPAYISSAAWAAYVGWSVLAPPELLEWDWWPVGHGVSNLLAWFSIVLFGTGLGLFWYSHRTLGSYWSIRIEIKREHQLVTNGPYRHVRHPLYTALFLGYLGTLLALQSWTLTVWFPVFIFSYVLFAKEEENIMERGFGEAYRAYRERTGMFLPGWRSMRGYARDAAGRSGPPRTEA